MAAGKNWYPYSGYQLDLRPCFEQYFLEDDKVRRNGVLMADLFLPVRGNLDERVIAHFAGDHCSTTTGRAIRRPQSLSVF